MVARVASMPEGVESSLQRRSSSMSVVEREEDVLERRMRNSLRRDEEGAVGGAEVGGDDDGVDVGSAIAEEVLIDMYMRMLSSSSTVSL